MIYFGVVLGIILLSVMTYMAVDKKSNFKTRGACLIALAVMILTVIICLFIVLTDTRVPVDTSVVIVGMPQETQQESGSNILALFFIVVFLLGIFALIAYLALKEHRKKFNKSR